MTRPQALAIYVHWPWCLRKCPYCDFNSHVHENAPVGSYVNALCAEIASWRQQTGPRSVVSVFFGGGTPSLMGGQRVGQVLNAIDTHYGLPTKAEVTVECNPTSSSAGLFKDLVAHGVNRVSVGVQALNDAGLHFLGREHSAADALQTLVEARATVANVSADVIYGLPAQDLGLWTRELAHLAGLGLDHISAYQLTIERQTAFYSAVRRGAWQPLDMDAQADFQSETQAFLSSSGYLAYEISNYARPGRQCRHNVHVWQYGDYLGVGAGAHGRVRLPDGQRWATAVRKDPLKYLDLWAAGESPHSFRQSISVEEAAQERIIMGLRLVDGIDITPQQESVLNNADQKALMDAIAAENLQDLIETGLMMPGDQRLQATPAGRDRLDGVLRRVLRPLNL